MLEQRAELFAPAKTWPRQLCVEGYCFVFFFFLLFNAKKGAHGPHLQLIGTRIPAAPPSPARCLSPETLHRRTFGHGVLTKCCSSAFGINVLALQEQSRNFLGKMAFFYGQVTRRMTTQDMNAGENCSISQTGQLEPNGSLWGQGGRWWEHGHVVGARGSRFALVWHGEGLVSITWGGYKSLQPGWASASSYAHTQSEGLLGLLKVPVMLLQSERAHVPDF